MSEFLARIKVSLQKALIGGALVVVAFAMMLLMVAAALILVPTIFIIVLFVVCTGLSNEEFKVKLLEWTSKKSNERT